MIFKRIVFMESNEYELKYMPLIAQLQQEVAYHKAMENQHMKDIRIYAEWVEKNSKCSKCFGKRSNTMGGCPCKECGLIGSMPWGG
jgi:hypothetical protein